MPLSARLDVWGVGACPLQPPLPIKTPPPSPLFLLLYTLPPYFLNTAFIPTNRVAKIPEISREIFPQISEIYEIYWKIRFAIMFKNAPIDTVLDYLCFWFFWLRVAYSCPWNIWNISRTSEISGNISPQPCQPIMMNRNELPIQFPLLGGGGCFFLFMHNVYQTFRTHLITYIRF